MSKLETYSSLAFILTQYFYLQDVGWSLGWIKFDSTDSWFVLFNSVQMSMKPKSNFEAWSNIRIECSSGYQNVVVWTCQGCSQGSSRNIKYQANHHYDFWVCFSHAKSSVAEWMEQYDLEIKWKHGIEFLNLLIVHRKIIFSSPRSIFSFLFHSYRTFSCKPIYELPEFGVPERTKWFCQVIWGHLGDNLTTWSSIILIIVLLFICQMTVYKLSTFVYN